MALSKTIHADGSATVRLVYADHVVEMPIEDWSWMLATAVVIEEAKVA